MRWRCWIASSVKTQRRVWGTISRDNTIPNALASSTRKGSGVYGFHWWPNGTTPAGKRRWPDAPLSTYARSGYNNNDLFVIPAWNMVIVRLGLDQQEDEITVDEYNVFLKRVGDALTSYH